MVDRDIWRSVVLIRRSFLVNIVELIWGTSAYSSLTDTKQFPYTWRGKIEREIRFGPL